VDGKIGFMIQEMPSVFVPIYFCWFHWSEHMNFYSTVGLLLFLTHYIQRTFIYTLVRMKKSNPHTLVTVLCAIMFTSINSYLITKYNIFWTHRIENPTLLAIGTIIFFIGYCTNIHSDHILLNLRKPGETCYRIPEGGMFEYVTSANYFGELVEWSGYSIAFFTPATLSFVYNSCCNLVPRANATYGWYVKKFGIEKFENKKSVIPFLY